MLILIKKRVQITFLLQIYIKQEQIEVQCK